ncbi:MAG: NAD(P)-dependent oxidoreductase, partial [Clostridia bacterium]|nr:NAD(P)-dependent oxidoreductase [Clostridia bacterium]
MSDKKTVLITGASGSMGSQVLKCVMGTGKFNCIILLRKKSSNEKLREELLKKYAKIRTGGKLEVVFGDISNRTDCDKVIEKSDYVLHCAAVIPPISDHDPKGAEKTNYEGARNLIDAIKASPRADEIKYVHVGTVAEYGNRNWKHPWGRVGDPLVPSVYDFYAITKLKAERYLLEAELPHWVVLRQSGVLHDNLFKNNMSDGLMFHTCWNVPIEWATARDSGLALQHLVEFDTEGKLPEKFWQNIYNIGNGETCRVTGYETMGAGFALMGAKAEQFFKPNWCAERNFHCFWYYDSDVLNDYLDFRRETWKDFWKHMGKRNWYFKFGALLPKSFLSKLTIQKLFKNSNSPMFWYNYNIDGRITAFYGSRERFEEIGTDWSKFPLFCKNQIKDENGNVVDYQERRDINNAKKYLLSHGYDESKPTEELDIEDMKQAAEFRGGKVVSETMEKGELYKKIKWQCHNGHEFESSPFTIIKAGHWCPVCCTPAPWNFDELSKHIPFFAQ